MVNIKTVSGCIVTYNNIGKIEETIESLLKFTVGVDFRLTVIDNGSTDGTPEFVEKNYSPRVKVIRNDKNIGFGAGHNLMLNELDSDYHCVINPDIRIKSDVITQMAAYMDENENIGLLSPQICFPDGRPQILGKRNPTLQYLVASRMRSGDEPGKILSEYAMLDEDLSKPCKIQNATGCFMMFRTSVFEKINGFDEGFFLYFEDCDITRRVNEVSDVIYYPYSTIYHVWGRDSKKNTRLMLIQIKSMFRYFHKWGCKG